MFGNGHKHSSLTTSCYSKSSLYELLSEFFSIGKPDLKAFLAWNWLLLGGDEAQRYELNDNKYNYDFILRHRTQFVHPPRPWDPSKADLGKALHPSLVPSTTHWALSGSGLSQLDAFRALDAEHSKPGSPLFCVLIRTTCLELQAAPSYRAPRYRPLSALWAVCVLSGPALDSSYKSSTDESPTCPRLPEWTWDGRVGRDKASSHCPCYYRGAACDDQLQSLSGLFYRRTCLRGTWSECTLCCSGSWQLQGTPTEKPLHLLALKD